MRTNKDSHTPGKMEKNQKDPDAPSGFYHVTTQKSSVAPHGYTEWAIEADSYAEAEQRAVLWTGQRLTSCTTQKISNYAMRFYPQSRIIPAQPEPTDPDPEDGGLPVSGPDYDSRWEEGRDYNDDDDFNPDWEMAHWEEEQGAN